LEETTHPVLQGCKTLVVGIANEESIAYGCAKAFRSLGAGLAITWLNEKARLHVEPLAREMEASITLPLDVRVPGQLEVSPGPLKTRAACGIKNFELLLNAAAQKAPLGELVDIMDVGYSCAYLATSLARRITGGTVYVDGGTNIVA
jgi:enoyl-[acyl-carrier-protein] reductase (NADH)